MIKCKKNLFTKNGMIHFLGNDVKIINSFKEFSITTMKGKRIISCIFYKENYTLSEYELFINDMAAKANKIK